MKKDLNQITEKIIGAAIAVHRELGPGLLESAYEACLTRELIEQELKFEQQKGLPFRTTEFALNAVIESTYR